MLTTLTVAGAVVASRPLLHTPKPMIGSLLLCLAVWSVLYGVFGVARQARWPGEITWFLAPWAGLVALLFGGVYYVDRGGWLWFHLSGFNTAVSEDFTDDMSVSPAIFVQRHPQFTIDPTNPSGLRLARGVHTLTHTVVIPARTELIIEPGTSLVLGAGCSLISYSPIVARGTPDSPIQFRPFRTWLKWGVIGLVGVDRCVFEHVYVEHARQARVNSLDFPGGLSLINTSGQIRDCQFHHMYGKDAIYVCQGTVDLANNRVEHAFKDGIDFDGGRGSICDNLLVDCEDEGIDLSENRSVVVRSNTIRDRRGGRIAATDDLATIRSQNTLELLPASPSRP